MVMAALKSVLLATEGSVSSAASDLHQQVVGPAGGRPVARGNKYIPWLLENQPSVPPAAPCSLRIRGMKKIRPAPGSLSKPGAVGLLGLRQIIPVRAY